MCLMVEVNVNLLYTQTNRCDVRGVHQLWCYIRAYTKPPEMRVYTGEMIFRDAA